MFNDDFVIGSFTEGTPSTRPAGYDDEALWRRIEKYIHWRWWSRPVQWVIRGEGMFIPPLKPVTVDTVHRFNDYGSPAYEPGDWVPQTKTLTPFGVTFRTGLGFYQITGTAGHDEDPPEDVLEAYHRLNDYLASVYEDGHVGATTVTDSVPGVSLTVRRPTHALARALELSGAADILKAYRNV